MAGKSERKGNALFTGFCAHRKEAISLEMIGIFFHLFETTMVAEIATKEKVHHRHRIFT